MPTYQYSCTECGHFFEQFQSFSDDALTECPVCGGRLRKVFNAVGVVFKGSGFYRNDSREAGKKSTSDAGSGSGSSSSETGSSSSSKDPAPKTTGTKDSASSSTTSSSSGSSSSSGGSSSSTS